MQINNSCLLLSVFTFPLVCNLAVYACKQSEKLLFSKHKVHAERVNLSNRKQWGFQTIFKCKKRTENSVFLAHI